jgi:CsoR family transcriptional regulator, copper-sensing transcriptional repressor
MPLEACAARERLLASSGTSRCEHPAAHPFISQETEAMASLDNPGSRSDIVNRLKRAEGQLRGVQRMVEEGESCVKVAQQLSAVRKALDSTYVHMTVCLVQQEVEARLGADAKTQAKLAPIMLEMERLIGRIT